MLSTSPRSAVLGIALATLLVACGKSTPEAPKPAPAASSTTQAAAKPTPARATSASSKTTETSPPSAGSSGDAMPAGATSTFKVRAVTLGNAVDGAQHVSQPATRFAPDDKTIYASVASTGVTPEVALNARWSYLEGAGQLISSVTQRLASDGPATTTFTLHNPDLWPEGKYNVQISVDGKPVETRTFTIGK